MFAQRFVLTCFALSCAILMGIAGCNKKSSEGGPPSTTTNQEDEKAAMELEAAKLKSINNLKQLAMAMHNYHDAMGTLPSPGTVRDKKSVQPPPRPDMYLSWRVMLLPYIEQEAIYNQIAPQLYGDPAFEMPASVAKTVISGYRNPLEKEPSIRTPYRVFVGGGAIFDANGRISLPHITDGTANTILIVEAAEPVEWSKPEDLVFDASKPLPKLGIFPGGFHAAMADGSVRWIPSDTPEETIKAMITRAGNEVIERPGKDVSGSNRAAAHEPIPAGNQAARNDVPKNDAKDDPDSLAKSRSINNLKQLGVAFRNYEGVYKVFPSPGLPKDMKSDDKIALPHSWRVALLPFIEQANLFVRIPENGKGPLPALVSDAMIKLYMAPNKKEAKPRTYYRVFVGNGAAFEWGKGLKAGDFADGLSNTIVAVESADPIEWASLDEFNYDPKKPLPKLGIFPGGFHALMGDGAVRWIPADTPEKTIRAMITRNGGETVELPK